MTSRPRTDVADGPSDPPPRPETPTGRGSGVRASDAERERTVRLLHDALGEGRLDLRETETRAAAAYAAVYRHDLPGLVEDLPSCEQAGAPSGTAVLSSWHGLWIALVWRARVSLWDGPDATGRSVPPGPGQQRVAALVIALAAVWLTIWAVVGAVL